MGKGREGSVWGSGTVRWEDAISHQAAVPAGRSWDLPVLSSGILDPASRPGNPRNLRGYSVGHQDSIGPGVAGADYMWSPDSRIWGRSHPSRAADPTTLCFSSRGASFRVAWRVACGSSSLAHNHLLPGSPTEPFSPVFVPGLSLPHPTQHLLLLCCWKTSVSWHWAFFGTAACCFFPLSFDLITLPPFPVPYFMPRGLTPNGPISLMEYVWI